MSAYLIYAFLLGVGATVVMDLWALMLRVIFSIKGLDYAFVGRWVLYMRRGKFLHDSIAAAAPISLERPVGWVVHYGTGVLFAAILAAATGPEWTKAPTLLPALAVGMGSIVAPFFVMQPAFGFGVAASRTPAPWKARLKSLITHTVFGCGLYVTALLLAAF
jgi:hypothetical protein